MFKSKKPPLFKELEYLQMYPDVAKAVTSGEFKSGKEHYETFGRLEGRFAALEAKTRDPRSTKRSTICSHSQIWGWISAHANKQDFSVLEIGSRAVSSNSLWKTAIPNADYIGFDVMAGPNVDVVGDAHRLSEYFPDKKFDLIFSFAVFEHLAMPWLVSVEIAKLLKVGGHTVHETHFSYSEHELPWHFFQFNSNALEVIFCKELGFTIIDSGLDNPIDGTFSSSSDEYLAGTKVDHLYCHSAIIAQKEKEIDILKFDWISCADRIGKESMYPSASGERWL